MKHLSIPKQLRLLLLALMCLVSASILTSCESNDEPDMCIEYYRYAIPWIPEPI